MDQSENMGHLSVNCPEPQKLTRCWLCNRVCEGASDHFWACTNKDFVSQPIEHKSIRAATLVANITFHTKANIYLIDGVEKTDVTGDILPLIFSATNGLLVKQDRAFRYHQLYPDENHRCVVNVVDASDNVRFSVRLMKDAFVINKKIRFHPDGTVEYRAVQPENEVSSAEVTFKVDSAAKFHIGIAAFGQSFNFQVHNNELKYMEPKWIGIQCMICYESMVGRDVKMTPCGHLFCSPCLAKSLYQRPSCPFCRASATWESLKNVFLYN